MLRRSSFALVTIAGLASSALADPKPKLGELTMDGHDAGHIMYADKCSNGANSDEPGRTKFIAALQADKQSKLARTIAGLQPKPGPDGLEFEVILGDWFPTYHLRDGCSDASVSWSAPLQIASKMSNEHALVTRFLVTIDDDVASDKRTFKLRSIVALKLREN
jgi:hypothetical protein